MAKVILTPFSGTPREIHQKAYEILNAILPIDHSPILKTDKGKPYLEKGELHFSISHTSDLIALAISDANVGIDCEKKDRIISHGVGKRFLGGNMDISAWVHFEAFSKLHGDGIPVGYDKMLTIPHVFHFLDAFEHTICICAFEDFEIELI